MVNPYLQHIHERADQPIDRKHEIAAGIPGGNLADPYFSIHFFH